MSRRTTSFLTALIAGVMLAAPAADAADGLFDRAWGKDVIASGGSGGFEICVAPVVCDTSSVGGSAGGEMLAPGDVAVEGGFAYVTDTGNDRILKYTAGGEFVRAWGKDVTVGGGTGFEICVPANGDVCQAGEVDSGNGGVDSPRDIAVVASNLGDTVYVTDRGNHRVMRYTSNGAFTRAWGKDVTVGGGTGAEICVNNGVDVCKTALPGALAGELDDPEGIATTAGSIFVANRGNDTIARFSQVGTPDRVWGKNAIAGGPDVFEVCVVGTHTCGESVTSTGLGGEMHDPLGLAADANGIYVADWGGFRIQKFTAAGGFLRAWGEDVVVGGGTGFEVCVNSAGDVCKEGTQNNLGTGAMPTPFDVTTDSAGNVYTVSDTQEAVLRFSQLGTFQRMWGSNVVLSGPNETAADDAEICVAGVDICQAPDTGFKGGEFTNPIGLGADGLDVYVAEGSSANRIQKFDDIPNTTGGGGGGTTTPTTITPATTPTQAELLAAALKKCKKIKGKKKKKKCKKKAKKKFA